MESKYRYQVSKIKTHIPLKFVFFQGATLTADQAECGFDHSCVYRIPIKSASHINFEPCTTYRVTIEVKSYEMVYCRHPTITTRKFTTNSRGNKLKIFDYVERKSIYTCESRTSKDNIDIDSF